MSVDIKQYIIEYTIPNGSTYYMSDMIAAEDPYEAIDELRKNMVGINIENVFVKLNIQGIDYDE